MPSVQTVLAAVLLASCCIGTSLMANEHKSNRVFLEAAKAKAVGHATQAAAVKRATDAGVAETADAALAGGK